MTTPAPVTIDDLAAPIFPDGSAAIFDAMAAMAPDCPLAPDALVRAAVDRTGLDDLGDPDGVVRARLELFTTALRDEAGLSPAGVVSIHTQLVQLLANRLQITALLRRHPEIHDVPIEAPIVIAGMPRTGTTHLHNLLAADPRLRSLPYWESLEPVLGEDEQPAPGQPDPRPARTGMGLDVLNAALPYFRRMHDMTVDHVHEEIQLLAVDLSGMYLETMALVPSWRDAYKATDQTPSYRYLRTVLQALTWLRGGTRWVLKSPQHLEQFGPLLATFPDATVVVTHRDPVAVIGSLTTMMAYTARLQVERPDPPAIARYWADRVTDLLRACLRDRHLLPASQSIDVRFDDFMGDELATVGRIYERAALPLDDGARHALARYLDGHQRDRHGRVVPDLAALGLDADELRRSLADYAARFRV